MSEEQKIIDLENEISFLKDALCEKQKEIEKLNFENHMIKKWNEQLDQNCISKDKIREKIKEYDKWIKEGGDYTESLEAQRYALNELLEEN